jgi:hypothetical protein
MPGNLLFANMSFPSLSGDDREDIKRLTNHVYMLQEELRYTMGNIGMDNFNETELKTLSSHITDGASLAELRATVDADGANIGLLAAYTGMTDVAEAESTDDFTDITKTYKIGANYYRYNGSEWVDDTSISSAALTLAAINGQSSASMKADRIDFTGFTTFLTANDLGEGGETEIYGGRISTGTLYTDALAAESGIGGTSFIAMQNGFDFRNDDYMHFTQSSYTPYKRSVYGLNSLIFYGDTALSSGNGTTGNAPTEVAFIKNLQSDTGAVSQMGFEIGAAHTLYLYGQCYGDTSMGAGVELDSVKPSAVATNGIYFSLQVVDAGVYAIKYRKESNGTFTQLDIATILS